MANELVTVPGVLMDLLELITLLSRSTRFPTADAASNFSEGEKAIRDRIMALVEQG